MSDRYTPTPQPQPHAANHHHEPPTMLKPPSREVMDEVAEQVVGRWESIPARNTLGCCPLDVKVVFNTYAPANDGEPYVTESETTGVWCFCVPIHQVGLLLTIPDDMTTREMTVGPLRDLTFVTVDHKRDAEGTLVITQHGTGVEEGRPTDVVQEWRFSRIRDPTMTWEQQTPLRVALEFRKVSRAHAPLSEKFRPKMEMLRAFFFESPPAGHVAEGASVA